MDTHKKNQIVVFSLDDGQYGMHLYSVERVVQAVEITPLPKAPKNVMGVIDVQGQIIPVIDIRKLFNLPARETRLSDQIIIARSESRSIAFMVDAVGGIIEHTDKQAVDGEKIYPGINYTEEVLKIKDNLIMVHNIDKFLSGEDEAALHEAISTIG